MTEEQKKEVGKKLLQAATASLIVPFLSVLLIGGFWYEAVTFETLADRLEGIEDSESYEKIQKQNLLAAAKKFENGEITSYQYKEECNRYVSDEYLIEYARSLDDENVKQIIADYDRESAELDYHSQVAMGGAMFGVVIGVAGTLAGLVGANLNPEYNNKINKEDNEQEK